MTASVDPDPNVLSVAEAARRMRCSEMTLRRMLAANASFAESVVVRIGCRTRISKVRLERWLHGESYASAEVRP